MTIICIGMSNAHANVLKDAGEELEIGELNGVDTNIFAQLDDNELWLGGLTWREHVLVLCASKNRYGGLSGLVYVLYACVAFV